MPANIAEGVRRRGTPEKARFLNIAEASLDEVVVARDLKYADTQDLLTSADEVSRLFHRYAKAILTSSTSDS